MATNASAFVFALLASVAICACDDDPEPTEEEEAAASFYADAQACAYDVSSVVGCFMEEDATTSWSDCRNRVLLRIRPSPANTFFHAWDGCVELACQKVALQAELEGLSSDEAEEATEECWRAEVADPQICRPAWKLCAWPGS